MALIEYWIQLENHRWDACPNNIDRMSGRTIKEITGKDPEDVFLLSPGTGVSQTRRMFAPLRDLNGKVMDALILRRYKSPTLPDQSDAWTVPDDRKVNPWDLNESDPTDSGTMGTIPGPVIECNVGDTVLVHFRNLDQRVLLSLPSPLPDIPLPIENRIHSLHPHGFVFATTSDGAYPLSPPDVSQPIPPSEAALWAGVPGFSGQFKRGDRVPPKGTFTYTWNTLNRPTTAGVWLYHDHSICDTENVNLGAIGIVVIHNPADTEQEVDIRDPADPTRLDPAFLPGGSPTGSPLSTFCLPLPPFPTEAFPFAALRILPHDLEGLGLAAGTLHGHGAPASHDNESAPHQRRPEEEMGVRKPVLERIIRRGDLLLELDEKFSTIVSLCLSSYRIPPSKAQYLQLFHNLKGGPGMLINGRAFMGNTPTMVGGPNTRMRFGVVGMGSELHTFHIHGHRWIIPGPDGNTTSAIQNSPQVTAVTQFEDTKIFGPANSFAFTIDEGSSFMDASPPIGEWHMHCHVLSHMTTGMMGSLLVVNGGESAFALPRGVHCPAHNGDTHPPNGETVQVVIAGFAFPTGLQVKSGGTVTFKNNDPDVHSVVWDTPGAPNNVPEIAANGGISNPVAMPIVSQDKEFHFHCGVHPTMLGKIKVVP